MAPNTHKVFVYGTLKQAEPNHYWFSKDGDGYHKFLSQARTLEKYPLIIATDYNIPFLLYSPGIGNYVKGEVYEADDKVLANLDYLEGYPEFYIREQCNLNSIEGENENMKAWIYFLKNFKPDLLNKPFLESYSNDDPHGLKYSTEEREIDYRAEVLL